MSGVKEKLPKNIVENVEVDKKEKIETPVSELLNKIYRLINLYKFEELVLKVREISYIRNKSLKGNQEKLIW